MNVPVVRIEDLGQAHFEQYPVWGRYGESDELFTPVLKTDPIPRSAAAEFIKADFYTPSGLHFAGFVVTDQAFAIGLFVDRAEFSFNRFLPDQAHKTLRELQLAIGKDVQVFPPAYRTNFRIEGKDLIAGTFDPFAKTSGLLQ
jgi:hypothetical protein